MRRFFPLSLMLLAGLVLGLLNISSASAQQQKDRRVTITNSSTYVLQDLTACRKNTNDCMAIMPGRGNFIAPGETRTVNFDDGGRGGGSCTRDLEFSFRGWGGAHELSGVNICDLNWIKVDAKMHFFGGK